MLRTYEIWTISRKCPITQKIAYVNIGYFQDQNATWADAFREAKRIMPCG